MKQDSGKRMLMRHIRISWVARQGYADSMLSFTSEKPTPNGTNKMARRHILCLALWLIGTHMAIPEFERPCEARWQQLAYNIYKQHATWRRIKFSCQIFYGNLPVSTHMPILSKPLNAEPWEVPPCEEIRQKTFEAFGFHPCLWQIHVVEAILKHNHNLISIGATGSGKTLTFWMPLCFTREVSKWLWLP